MRRIYWGVAFLMLSMAGLHAQTLTTTVGAGNHLQTRALPAPEAAQGGLVTLRGNTRPEAIAKNDRGRVSDDLTLNHMMLQLRRSPEQEQALQQFINDIHDHASPLFHHWITATEFGQRYGVAPAEVARVTDWLESQGFTVNLVYPNQMVIDFTGSAGQIRQAFHTEIHHLLVNGEAHIANMSDPQIPPELASTVAGVVSLNDFRLEAKPRLRPNYTASGYYFVTPADLWTIYNFSPAFAQGFSGQYQTIVVVENTDLYTTQDWSNYRSAFGLASAYPLGTLAQVHPGSCTDPGIGASDNEATLDVEMATAGAPSATIELASCADSGTTPGFFIALLNLVNGVSPPAIVSSSQGTSESVVGAAFNASINSMFQQAVTEGVSVFVSSGDTGGASTDQLAGDTLFAEYGITVSGATSTPYNVSVGGTDFADSYEGTNTTYWSSTNNAGNYGSALSYIPEIPWNDSCASVLLGDYHGVLPTYGPNGLCYEAEYDYIYGTGNYGELLNIAAGSGGPSGCATGAPDPYTLGVVSGTCAGYPKPSWQAGFIGNPSDGVRDIPDVSLFAANGIWGHAYVICFSDPYNGGSTCSGAPVNWTFVGGTSASAPIWAAIQSLANQASGSRWGNPDSEYYSRAATEYGVGGTTSCKSALGNGVASNCIFYDVTQIPLIHGGSGTGGDSDIPCNGMNCYLPSGTYISGYIPMGVFSKAGQPLTSVLVTDLGSGYTSNPTCTLSGGGGSGATCSAIKTGVVTSASLTGTGGSGYTSFPTCTLTGGGGSGATCAVDLYTSGVVADVFLTNYGSSYTSAPTCTISGGGGTGATCTATEGPGISASLISAGSGYTSLPDCVLSGGGGSGGACSDLALNSSVSYQPAFGAATGWDFATGIGTVNVSNLVNSFISSSVPSVSFSASSLGFGNQPTGTTSSAQVETVTNTGTGSLTISTVTISGTNAGDFAKSADTCTGATVTPNSTCAVSVTFTPSATGSRSASLSFADDASGSPQTVDLTGTGVVSAPVAGVLPGSLTFGNQSVGTTSAAQTETVSNTGTANLTISTVTISGTNAGDFAKSADACTGATVTPNSTCAVSVTFTPSATGSRSASLSFTDNASGSPQTFGLTGTGQNFTLGAASGSSTSATVAPGSAATYTLSVAGEGVFNQSVSFTCTGAPSEATCAVSPNPATAGSSATNVTVTVTTTAPSLSVPRSRPLPPAPPLSPGLRGLLMLALALGLVAWAIGRRNPLGVSRWRSTMVPLAAGLLLALALAGCGGGGNNNVTHNPGTPAGTYTLTVTGTVGSGSSALSHSVTLTLTVS